MDVKHALALHQAGKFAAAEAAYREILRADPDQPEAIHLLGMLAFQTGRSQEAIELLERSIQLSPGLARYHSNLGSILGKLNRAEEGIAQVQEAIRLQPTFPEAYNNLGVLFETLQRPDEAVAAYRKAIKLRPEYAEAHNHLGNVLRRVSRIDEAEQCHRRAIELRPNYAQAYENLAATLSERAELDAVLGCMRKVVELRPKSAAAHSALLYTLHYDPRITPAQLFREHREWARRHGRPWITPKNTTRRRGDRLRVGYISPDFREHTVPRFFEPILSHQDRSRIEAFCYSDVVREDAWTARLKGLAENWRNIRDVQDEIVAGMIQDDQIDVLVDLRGHAGGNRLPLLSAKPAPVQAVMIGYFDTTGIPAFDYRITDAIQDPPGMSEHFHTERLVRLPQSCWCYRPDPDAPSISSPPALRRGHITFGCIGKAIKISPDCGRLWALVLDAVPGSRLLLSLSGGGAGMDTQSMFRHLGLSPDRVDLVPKLADRRLYLSRFNEIDIVLDTYPFNGITTTCDGLWMGVPHVTLAGATSVSRAGASILSAVAHPEFIAHDAGQYIGIAKSLAHDVPGLAVLRAGLRQQMRASPLTDEPRFASHFDAALLSMAERTGQ